MHGCLCIICSLQHEEYVDLLNLHMYVWTMECSVFEMIRMGPTIADQDQL